MQGMSTAEWSRYLTSVVGLPGPQEKVATTVVDRMAERYRTRLPLLPRPSRWCTGWPSSGPWGWPPLTPLRLIETVLQSAGR